MSRLPALCHLSREELPLQSSAALPDCEYRYCWIRLKHACPNLWQLPRLRYLNLPVRVYREQKTKILKRKYEFTNIRADVRKQEAKSENLFLKMCNRYKVNFSRIIILVTNNQMCKKQMYLPFHRSRCFVQIQSGHMHFPRVRFTPVDG